MTHIKRSIEPIVKKAVQQYPALVLTGPRQAGKTTLLKHLFGSTHRYLSLEPPDVRTAAATDPRGFIELYPPPVIFDEIQYVPELLFYIKEKIDQKRDVFGQYILTGSQNLLLLQQVTESLAGRSAILKLLPLSYPEMKNEPLKSFIWEEEKACEEPGLIDFWKMMIRGSYPELTLYPDKDAILWQASYLQTYLERDIRNLRQIGDLTQFQIFLRALAARSGSLLNLTDIAKEIGMALNTVKSWISILEASYQIIILRPYFPNLNKRMVKTPKVYFTDVGTLCYLLGLHTIEPLISGTFSGQIMETFIITEVYKRLLSRGIEPRIYFWRTASGSEVDLLVEESGTLIPIEIKSSSTPKMTMAEGIVSLNHDLPKKVAPGFVVHLGPSPLPLGPKIKAIPFSWL